MSPTSLSGSGGSIRIEGADITLGTLDVSGGSNGGGGLGRIAIYYDISLTNSATKCTQSSLPVTPTAVPSATPTAAPGTNPGTTGLISWWTLNENSGTRNDSYGANHLTDNNTVGSATGIQGGTAAQFASASSEYLSIADNANLSMGANVDFTIGGWVNLTSLGATRTIITKGSSTGANKDYEYLLTYDQTNGKFAFGVGNGTTSGFVTSTVPSTSQWYFVVGWYNSASDTMSLQVNHGTPVSAAYTAGSFDSTSTMTIGRLGGYNGGYMNGLVDEVFLYKRVLTDGERSWLYNGGYGRTYSSLAISSAAWYSNNYTYSTTPPHAVSSVDRVNFSDTFKYDENGNMTCRVESGVTYLQTYSAENRIASIVRLASGTC